MSDQGASPCSEVRAQHDLRHRPGLGWLLAAAVVAAAALSAGKPVIALAGNAAELRPLERLLASVQRPERAGTVMGSITPGGSPVTVSNPGDNAALSFSASAGQRVSVRTTNKSKYVNK